SHNPICGRPGRRPLDRPHSRARDPRDRPPRKADRPRGRLRLSRLHARRDTLFALRARAGQHDPRHHARADPAAREPVRRPGRSQPLRAAWADDSRDVGVRAAGRRQSPGARDEQRLGPSAAHPRGRAAVPARADAHRGRGALRGPLCETGPDLVRAVAQRVREAAVRVGGEEIARMREGLLALVGVAVDDTLEDAAELARKLIGLRVFPDADGRMNRSLLDTGGTLGVVSPFTLLGDARQARRPSDTRAAPPERAAPLLDAVLDAAREAGVPVVTGRFQAAMDVSLVNAGPATTLLDTRKEFRPGKS